jgi:hypothetical protein
MGLRDRTKPKTATADELAAQLTTALAAHRDALAALDAARDAFDLDATPDTEHAMLAARDAERLAAEYLARAERLLGHAREREAQQERERLVARKAELEASLAHAVLTEEREPTLRAEVDALLAAAAAHAQRREVEMQISRRRSELLSVQIKLGEVNESQIPLSSITSTEPDRLALVAALDAQVSGLPSSDPRLAYMNQLVDGFGGRPRHYAPAPTEPSAAKRALTSSVLGGRGGAA